MRQTLTRWLRRRRRSAVSTEYRLAGPIRGELLGAEHLAERARTLAARQRLAPPRRGPRPARLLNRLEATRPILAEAYHRLARPRRAPPPPRRGPRPPRLLNPLDPPRHILEEAYHRLARVSHEGTDIGPAGEWPLDNYHVVLEHAREVHQTLPAGY